MNTTEALLKAIKAEHEGYGFYMMASRSSSDEKGKKIFETLAAEELDHMHFLKGQYDAIIKTGKPDSNIRLGAKHDLSGSFPIFSEAIKGRLKGAQIEMSALAIGIQLELDAMNFYKAQAQSATDPEIKKFFQTLSDWEAGHYHALLNQETALKEDYWAESGFAPF
jgi:rubrerythrin